MAAGACCVNAGAWAGELAREGSSGRSVNHFFRPTRPSRFRRRSHGSVFPDCVRRLGTQFQRKSSVSAAAARQGDDWKRWGTRRRAATSESSEACNDEILLFLFQMDLSTRLQRALNGEQYETAQQLREKIAEVGQEVARQREAKMGTVSSKDEAQDTALTLLHLKAELQRAIDGEDYPGAALIRDRMSKVEATSLAASARALVYQNLKFSYRLGQRVRHSVYGYLGIICGMDPTCCESREWIERAGVSQLPRGNVQPFYQILVNVHQQPSMVVAYVAEDSLVSMEEATNVERFDHPYTYFLFFGMDSNGDFIPSKQLREKYNAARHELPWEEDDELSGSG